VSSEQLPLIEPTSYELRTVADFAKVPRERRAACLAEFATYLKMHDDFMVLMTPEDRPGCVTFHHMVWIDDGARNVSVTLEVAAQGIERAIVADAEILPVCEPQVTSSAYESDPSSSQQKEKEKEDK
jgi:hypothetical protein